MLTDRVVDPFAIEGKSSAIGSHVGSSDSNRGVSNLEDVGKGIPTKFVTLFRRKMSLYTKIFAEIASRFLACSNLDATTRAL